ncbi:MAG: DUF6101 family protein [Bosea sp. (in: a-proteobacteria)]|uniref:DUF6101 family protein n=1 Tax=Bosea sp. (in: a-proteobacteria) TaxID=1871050 RepID=UPI002733877C|nr:DUF6101 family protein [Bosea sp. (in: a-proteobacteria)]MDP3255274.1 DUF6101 family protein [Bosea sp. (in: a-proteobacteria)]MDP3318571.1 DUF6101 family protein [Bosea sp. (in: a-proteobacteria)]
MARVTPAAGEFGFMPQLPGGATDPTIVPRNPMPAQPDGPRIERIGTVRILRGAAGWRGVSLRLANPAGEDEIFQLALTAGDGRSITIATVDGDEAVALWRDCGRASGMPLLLETSDGEISQPFPQIGRLALGPIRVRRRHSFLNGRRPRFLVRRKTGKLAERPIVVAGERLTD